MNAFILTMMLLAGPQCDCDSLRTACAEQIQYLQADYETRVKQSKMEILKNELKVQEAEMTAQRSHVLTAVSAVAAVLFFVLSVLFLILFLRAGSRYRELQRLTMHERGQ